jgi:uncharacterized metal-binding protein
VKAGIIARELRIHAPFTAFGTLTGIVIMAGIIHLRLSREVSACCKVCGIDKKEFDLPYVRRVKHESMCNPAGQADLLNKAGSKPNILCGLWVGHDAVFSMVSQAIRCIRIGMCDHDGSVL